MSMRLGTVRSIDGQAFDVDATLENIPAVLFDALVLPDGEEAVTRLAKDALVIYFRKDHYRHGKTIWVGEASAQLLAESEKRSRGDGVGIDLRWLAPPSDIGGAPGLNHALSPT